MSTAPTMAAAFAELRNDYTASKQTRFRRKRAGVTGIGRSADYHYRLETDFLRMMETARDIDRNDVVVGQGLDRVVANVVQDGFTPDPDTGDEKVDNELKSRWRDFAESPNNCHAAGKFTFNDLERLALRHTLVDGDIFGLPLEDGTIDTVEAHRCRTPRNTTRNVCHGVLLNKRGGPSQYWFTKNELDPNRSFNKVSDVDQRRAFDEMGFPEVIHLFNPQRVSQSRGVTSLARIVDTTSMHDDIEFAKLVQQQLVSCWGLIHKTDAVAGQSGPRTTETHSDGSTQYIEGVSPGMLKRIGLDEEMQAFTANVPSQEFFSHAKLILTFIAVNLGIPLAVLLLDPSQTNFSGWRGAIDQARTGFRQIQGWMSRRWHRPIWRWKVRQWMSEDSDLARLNMSGTVDMYRHKWKLPAWDYIEPTKDAAADLLQQRNGLNSPRRIQAKRGREWSDVAREIVEDNALAIKLACERAAVLTTECGVEIHWREVLSLPTPDGVNVTIGSEPPPEPRAEDDSDA